MSFLDGEFNTGDLVQVLIAGKYEKHSIDAWGFVHRESATWSEGDWNCDGVFDTGDLVLALQDGGYEMGPREPVAVPEPTSLMPVLLGLFGLATLRGRTLRLLRV